LKAVGKLIGGVWVTVFFAFVAATFYENGGNELPEEVAAYRDVFQSWLESFLGSWMFFVVFLVGWFAVSYFLGKESGWQKLAEDYAESGGGPSREFSTVSGYVGSVPYQGSLRVSAHPLGLALRVFFLFRFGSTNLNIPWTAIESISVTGSAAPPGKRNFLEKLSTRITNSRYAHIRLARHPDQTLIVPWTERIRAGIPSTVKLVVEDN
jgi:hypothetical protein